MKKYIDIETVKTYVKEKSEFILAYRNMQEKLEILEMLERYTNVLWVSRSKPTRAHAVIQLEENGFLRIKKGFMSQGSLLHLGPMELERTYYFKNNIFIFPSKSVLMDFLK